MKTTIIAISAAVSVAAMVNPVNSGVQAEQQTATVTISQSGEFSFFRVHRQGKDGATATWGTNLSGNVTGFRVERTYQDPTDPYASWDNAGYEAYSGARSYSFTDTNVMAGVISYRVVIMLNDGTELTSGFESIQIRSHG